MTFVLLTCTPMLAAVLLLHWEPRETRHRRHSRPPQATPPQNPDPLPLGAPAPGLHGIDKCRGGAWEVDHDRSPVTKCPATGMDDVLPAEDEAAVFAHYCLPCQPGVNGERQFARR